MNTYGLIKKATVKWKSKSKWNSKTLVKITWKQVEKKEKNQIEGENWNTNSKIVDLNTIISTVKRERLSEEGIKTQLYAVCKRDALQI